MEQIRRGVSGWKMFHAATARYLVNMNTAQTVYGIDGGTKIMWSADPDDGLVVDETLDEIVEALNRG